MRGLVALLASGLLVLALSARAEILFVSPPRSSGDLFVWRVLSTGAAEEIIRLPASEKTEEGTYWGNSALPSRDHASLAYVSRGDLWILDKNKAVVRVTTSGAPLTKTHADISSYPVLWSWDGKRLLYRTESGDLYDPEGQRQPLVARKADFGFYVYDLSTRRSDGVPPIKGLTLAWLPDDTIVSWLGPDLFQRAVGAGEETQVRRLQGMHTSQVSVSPSGKSMLANAGRIGAWSQIMKVEIDGSDWHVTPLPPRGRWAEYQRPAYSPSGSKFAYTQGHNNRNLIVGGKTVYSDWRGSYAWVTDDVLVVEEWGWAGRNTSELVLIDADSGRQISRHAFTRQ